MLFGVAVNEVCVRLIMGRPRQPDCLRGELIHIDEKIVDVGTVKIATRP